MQLSKNFSYYEMFPGYENKFGAIPKSVVESASNLVNRILQPAREKLNKPIIVTSAYRDKERNKAVGGATNSRHLLGDAADIYVKGMPGIDLFKFLLHNFHDEIGGLGLYFPEKRVTFIHIDLRPKPDEKITTWYQAQNGNYIKIPSIYHNIFKVEIAWK